MNNFADKLKELMQEYQIEPKGLAKDLGVSESIVYRWLKGELGLLLPTAVKIADFFDCSLDYLFGRSENDSGSFKECPPFDIQFRKVIKEQKVSQNKLTKDKVISRGSLNSWLNLKQIPHIESVIKLADYFAVTMDYLVGREN